jgi:hypothetical protein
MKNLTKGFITFLVQIIFFFFYPNVILKGVWPWLSLIILIAILLVPSLLYFYWGYQTIVKEKAKIAGTVFILLGIIMMCILGLVFGFYSEFSI